MFTSLDGVEYSFLCALGTYVCEKDTRCQMRSIRGTVEICNFLQLIKYLS